MNTSIQTSDGRRYEYDFDAYTEEMRRQPSLPTLNTGDVLRLTEGYVIPAGSTVIKFFFEHPDRQYPDFSFFTD